jgi:ribonuclease P protein component
MLSKQHRFHGHNSLNYVYRQGKTVRSPHCAMKFTPGKYENYRVAIVVAKKVDKSAPARNRIRRRVYEAIRTQADGLLTNQDIVVTIFDDSFLTIPYAEIAKSIKRQLRDIAKATKPIASIRGV